MNAFLSVVALALLAFELVLIARLVVDWVGALAPAGAARLGRARNWAHELTEPVLAPVRRVVPPLRLGSIHVDLAFTVVFVAVVLLRTVVTSV